MTYRPVFIAIILTGLAACDLLDPKESTRTLVVQHHRAECIGVDLQLCYLVKTPREEGFGFFYSHIEGFQYEWGYVYEILVEEYPVENPPADASSVRTVLRTERSKERVAPGTQFEMFLTGGFRIEEVEPNRYRFYNREEFDCPPGTSCDELRSHIQSGARLWYRFEHPTESGEPLVVVEWAETSG